MRKVVLLMAAILLLGTMAIGANAAVNTYAEEFTNTDNWPGTYPTGWANVSPSMMTVAGGQLTVTPPPYTSTGLGGFPTFTNNSVYRIRFRTTTTPGTYAYIGYQATGWGGVNNWQDEVLYLRLDTDQLILNCKSLTGGGNGNALPGMVVTPGEWHVAQMIWGNGSVEVSLDGVSGGTYYGTEVPVGPMQLWLDTLNNTANAGAQVFEVDYVRVKPIAETGSIGGTINLMDFVGDRTLTPVKVDFLTPGIGDVVKTAMVTLDASGVYQIDGVEPGNYDLAFSAVKWLRKLVFSTEVVSNNVTPVSVDLVNGDVDGDNEITSTDLSILGLGLGLAGD